MVDNSLNMFATAVGDSLSYCDVASLGNAVEYDRQGLSYTMSK